MAISEDINLCIVVKNKFKFKLCPCLGFLVLLLATRT